MSVPIFAPTISACSITSAMAERSSFNIIAPKAKLVLKGFNRPPGQDRLVFKGVVSGLPTTPPLDPVTSGIRLLIEGANGTGNVLDVTVPPGAFSSTTGTGWK